MLVVIYSNAHFWPTAEICLDVCAIHELTHRYQKVKAREQDKIKLLFLSFYLFNM